MYLYAKGLSEPKYEFLIKKREDVGINHLNDSNAFIECSNTMHDVYEDIDVYNSSRKRKTLIVFDDMIVDIMMIKKIKPWLKNYLLGAENWIFHSWLSLSLFFPVPKDVRLNSTYYLIMKINNKRELQNIAINHSADIDYQDFMKIYRECTKNLLIFWQ